MKQCNQCYLMFRDENDLCPKCHTPAITKSALTEGNRQQESKPAMMVNERPIAPPPPGKRYIRESISGKPLNPLAQCLQDTCCGTTCDKQQLIQRVDELESRCKGLTDDLNGIDDLNATFDERVEKKCKLAFMARWPGVPHRTEAELEKAWLQFKAEQGL